MELTWKWNWSGNGAEVKYTHTVHLYTHNHTFLAEMQCTHARRKNFHLRASLFTAGIIKKKCSILCDFYATLHTSCFCELLVASAWLVAWWGGTAFHWPFPWAVNSSNNCPARWVQLQGVMAVVGYAGLCNTGKLVFSKGGFVRLKNWCIRC